MRHPVVIFTINWYDSFLISAMAQRQDKESALHYFDFRSESDGISTTDLGIFRHDITIIVITHVN